MNRLSVEVTVIFSIASLFIGSDFLNEKICSLESMPFSLKINSFSEELPREANWKLKLLYCARFFKTNDVLRYANFFVEKV